MAAHIVAGLLFIMAYPYVTTGITSLVAVGGALLGGALWYAVQQGW